MDALPLSRPMDPKTYCDTATPRLEANSIGSTMVERAQVQLLLAHFSTHAPDEVTFTRALVSLARSAGRAGRRTLGQAAQQILADWQRVRT